MRTFHKRLSSAIAILGALVIFFGPADLRAQATAISSRDAAFKVVKAYLRATRGHDFDSAYRHISSLDRSVRDKNTYLRSEENFSGFSLDLSKRLAASMDVWVIEHEVGSTKARFEIGYRAPTADEMAAQFLDWKPEKLNALSPTEQTGIVESMEKLKKTGKMITIEGRETLNLVSEKDGWKIFLDWRSRHRVLFKTKQARIPELAVRFLRNNLLVRHEEPFQIDLKITNRTSRAIAVRLNHLFEPRQAEKNIDMIACGSLAPLRLRSQETQQISSAYLLRGNIALNTPVEIIYDFTLAPMPETRDSHRRASK
jgi:hypothetical protein